MKRVKFSAARKAVKGKGFLIALLLCFSAVGVSTYVAYTGAINKLSGGNGDETENTTAQNEYAFDASGEAVNRNQEGIPLETSSGASKDVTEPEETEDANNYLPSTQPKLMPIENAEVIKPFSNGELVFSETLEVWKTHDGIDLKAETGTEVRSMTEGKVLEVKDDPLWGITVVIDHGDGIIGYYQNMGADVTVNAEQTVKAGDIIGKVGNTADIESVMESHLHFGIKKNDKWIDPVTFITQ